MTTEHKPTERPMDGYYTFLRNHARYRELSEKRLADAIAEALHMTVLDHPESTAISLAAKLSLVALTSGGIELMFDDRDNFKGVVT